MNATLVIRVKDTGTRIDKDELPSIWKVFGYDDRSKRAQKCYVNGSGLGLRIAKKIVESHHGRIYVESTEVDKGTTFVIELPVAEKIVEIEKLDKKIMGEECEPSKTTENKTAKKIVVKKSEAKEEKGSDAAEQTMPEKEPSKPTSPAGRPQKTLREINQAKIEEVEERVKSKMNRF